jgi:RimJ/RimL family protein N-acetyltransferase
MTDPTLVKLRAAELSDLPFTRKCRNDPAVHLPALGRRFPITEAGEEAWFRTLGAGSPPVEVTYVVAACTDDAPLGLTTLRRIDWVNRTAMFGVWIAPEAQGRGAGKAATVQMVSAAFGRFNLRKVSLEVLASNDRAVALYKSLGFAEEGRFVDDVLVDGECEDVIRMAITASRWADRASGS